MKHSIKAFIACLLSLALIVGTAVPAAATEEQEVIFCADYQEAAATLRDSLVQRKAPIVVSFSSEKDGTGMGAELMNAALVHDGISYHGDYLRWSIRKCQVQTQVLEQDGQYLLTFTYTPTYYTTLEQEQKLDVAIQELLDELDVYRATDYEKICAIYDYICENVLYDNWGILTDDPLIFSAYAALIRKAAVCQGYATLFYRLALELGVDAAVISGKGKNTSHGWNIVRLKGKYYNVDATWDATLAQSNKPYEYFLRCDGNFSEHVPASKYTTEEFLNAHPMAQEDYDATRLLPGDINDNGVVDEDDAICLLRQVLLQEEASADFTGDGVTDENDAIYLLRYALMPDRFPI